MQLDVFPLEESLAVQRHIVVRGASPNSLVTLRAQTMRKGGLWQAQATYYADANGTVDLRVDAPVRGDYGRVAPMGLFWAQLPDPGTTVDTGVADVTRPIATEIYAWEEAPRAREAKTASVQITQNLMSDGVRRIPIADAGLVGTVFTPAGSGPHPTVVVLNGSGGGVNEMRGAMYASQGIQAFALGYFGAPGLPKYISNTPLEYLHSGLSWAVNNLNPAGGKVSVSGQSRGGELALLLGSRYPKLVGGVVAYVPGAYVHGGQGAADPEVGWDGPTWTEGGLPLPHLWQNNPEVRWQPWGGEPPPNRFEDVTIRALQAKDIVAAARIPVEEIRGPVLTISGQDDRLWPSSLYSRIVMRTLHEKGHRWNSYGRDYPDAGHSISLPYLPSTAIPTTHPVSGIPLNAGGTPHGNALANCDSFAWACSLIEEAADR